MKSLSILFLLIFSLQAFAWEVTKKKDEYFLVSKDQKMYAIISEGGDPVFSKVETLSNGLERVIYKAGVAGTSELKAIYRGLLMSTKDKKVLGDFPVSYQSLDGKNKVEVKWILNKDHILIEDPETETTQKVQLR